MPELAVWAVRCGDCGHADVIREPGDYRTVETRAISEARDHEDVEGCESVEVVQRV